MKKRTTLFAILLLLFSTCLMAQKTTKSPVNMNPASFRAAIAKTPGTVLDVRTPEEVANGKIEGAIVIDFYEEDFKKQLKKLDRTKPVYVYCAAGGRSADAAEMLVELGFTQVYNLEGGYRAWKAAGLPVVKPALPVTPGQ